MTRFSEDELQSARLALIEKGGPSTVPHERAWLRRVAASLASTAYRQSLIEMGAWYELNGLTYQPLLDYRAAKAEWQREYYKRRGRPSRVGKRTATQRASERRYYEQNKVAICAHKKARRDAKKAAALCGFLPSVPYRP